MPFYEYYCEQNGETVSVRHAMKLKLKTWGEVCRHAERDPGFTAPDTPVIRLIARPLPMVFKLKGIDKDAPDRKLRL